MSYNQLDHIHCWNTEKPPCGIKGRHRCCLCTLPVPKINEGKKCTCGEPHISKMIEHCYDGKPCYLKPRSPLPREGAPIPYSGGNQTSAPDLQDNHHKTCSCPECSTPTKEGKPNCSHTKTHLEGDGGYYTTSVCDNCEAIVPTLPREEGRDWDGINKARKAYKPSWVKENPTPIEEGEQKDCKHGNKGLCIGCYNEFREAPTPTESEDWEKEFDENFLNGIGRLYKYSWDEEGQHPIHEALKSFISLQIQKAKQEEHQFFLNILDGIDIADEEMGNKGGGTKAIRHALNARYPFKKE